ncbi:MAG: tetratricopeptide repeat protein [Leptolyngbyaceae cyanobacterium SM1_1_3]|nr:tetratricopeptide repeat protein [Leptolyngbyaceae cyanobacterium SM1_1_3]
MPNQNWSRLNSSMQGSKLPGSKSLGLAAIAFLWSQSAAAIAPFALNDSSPDSRYAQAGLLEELKDFDYWRNLCELQASAQQYDEAIAACEKAIELEPRDSNIWALHSGILVAQQQYPAAIASASQSLSLNAANSLALTYQCISFSELGQSEKALDRCNEALRVNGSWGNQSPALAWFRRGIILAQQEDYEQALVAYERVLLIDPADSLVLAYRCEALRNLASYEAAISACQEALVGSGDWRDQSSAIAWYNQGLAQAQLKDYEAAIALYDRAIEVDPENALVWTAQGRALEQLEKYAEALTSYSRAVDLKPEHSRALVGQCTLLNKLEQYEMAIAACKQALAPESDGIWWEIGPAQAWIQQAYALTGQGDYEAALASANRAVGISPNFTEAWSDRSVILWYLERYAEALASTQKAIELDPTYARAWANQARILRTLEEDEAALSAYERALELDPTDAMTWANRSVVLWHLQSYEPALLSANRAINLDLELFQGWYNRAVNLAALSRYEEATAAYQQALQIDAENADAWAGLALAFSRLGRLEDAKVVATRALAINPTQSTALALMQNISQQQSQSPMQ